MNPFRLDSSTDDLYVGCKTNTRTVVSTFPSSVIVYKLKKKGEVMVFADDWEAKSTINAKTTSGFNSLLVNGFKVDILALSQVLCKHQLRVNWLGYCFQQPVINAQMRSPDPNPNPRDPVHQFKRMNDMLFWTQYGAIVNPQKAIKPSIRWDRVDIINGNPVLYRLSDKEESDKCKDELDKSKQEVKHLVTLLGEERGKTKVVEDLLEKEQHKTLGLVSLLDEERGKTKGLNDLLNKERGKTTGLQTHLDKERGKTKGLEDQLTKERNKNKKLDNKLFDTEVKVMELENDIDELKTRIKSLKKKKKEADDRIKQLLNENKHCHNRNNQLQKENNCLRCEVSRLRLCCNTRPVCVFGPPRRRC